MGIEENFIETIAPYVQSWRDVFEFGVASAIIAQACLESAYGTSDKAMKNNYFGLKYKKNRVTCNNGTFTSTSKEYKDGVYYPIVTEWYTFADMNTGVEGYFQFIGSGPYKVKGITDPTAYLTELYSHSYATGPNYVEKNMSIVNKYNLTQYDKGASPMPTLKPDSPLARLIINSPNTYGLRNCPIDRITIHHMGCYPSPSAEEQCKRFAQKSRHASATYCIGNDGDICQSLLEAYAPGTSNSRSNDMRAITIEVANCSGAPNWCISPAAMNSLIALCTDICQRNKIKALIWSDSKSDRVNSVNGCNMTMHRDFASTTCPGPFLMENMPNIALAVDQNLSGGVVPTPAPAPNPSDETSGYFINGVDYDPVFDPVFYADNYGDLKTAFGYDAIALFNHFKTFGMKEHRQADANFDPVAYRANNADLDEVYGDNWPEYYTHYCVFGKDEYRSAV